MIDETAAQEPLGPGAAAPRPEDDDYDLLTYGEATARLLTEIRSTETHLRELQAAGGGASETAAAQSRLDALRETAQRHSRQRLTGENFVVFFGRDPRAGR